MLLFPENKKAVAMTHSDRCVGQDSEMPENPAAHYPLGRQKGAHGRQKMHLANLHYLL
jgi:hypothetical protein